MKHIFLAALAASCFATANAQYTPEKGSISTEVQFNPFSDNFETFKLDNASLKFRYFITNDDAIRVKLGLGINSSKDNGTEILDNKTEDPTNYTIKNNSSETVNKKNLFSIGLGYERHFKANNRLDLYAGAEIYYTKISCSAKETTNADVTTFASSVLSHNVGTSVKDYKNCNAIGQRSSSEFGFNIFTGAEFYVYKGLYLGAELGLNFGNYKNPNAYYTNDISGTNTVIAGGTTTTHNTSSNFSGETGITTSVVDGVTTTTYSTVYTSESKNTTLKFYVEPALKIGWTF